MRPKITTCRHISRSIAYNEQKVELKAAERLTAANMLKPLPDLTADNILRRFNRRMELNDRVRTSLHITLNFDPQDKLTNWNMRDIAHLYMKEIGFQRQPWIAWRHNDAGHPHCHIVSTHVQGNGDPIDLYKIGENQSEKARLKIEKIFGLMTSEIKKEQRQRQTNAVPAPHGPRRLIYGEQPLSRAMAGIVEHVTEKYNYTTLLELNAVLHLYNVEAYTGRPGTKLHADRGLLYRALDEHGHYIGRPLKASFFDCKPTLDNLEKKFAQNLSIKQDLKRHVEVYSWICVRGELNNLESVRKNLARESINLVITQDRSGMIIDVAYVDFKNRVVIAGKELHHDCNAAAVQKILERQKVRLAREQTLTPAQRQALHHRPRLRPGM